MIRKAGKSSRFRRLKILQPVKNFPRRVIRRKKCFERDLGNRDVNRRAKNGRRADERKRAEPRFDL